MAFFFLLYNHQRIDAPVNGSPCQRQNEFKLPNFSRRILKRSKTGRDPSFSFPKSFYEISSLYEIQRESESPLNIDGLNEKIQKHIKQAENFNGQTSSGQNDQATTSSTQACNVVNPMETYSPPYDNFQNFSGPFPTETNENMWSMEDLWSMQLLNSD
ncbi:hypothetical protein Ccrd_019225 [Cynara cardunculus var. scolymus]|uniref:Uncharacterized protein n=1 Tax=Cynara cardunculus var. scolymus TaxID=59895 RepID=A0A103Y4V7_CYNCS|nr:hypothetical protein Ccrd_019225 [Cynara cardunculus var. scolymus]